MQEGKRCHILLDRVAEFAVLVFSSECAVECLAVLECFSPFTSYQKGHGYAYQLKRNLFSAENGRIGDLIA